MSTGRGKASGKDRESATGEAKCATYGAHSFCPGYTPLAPVARGVYAKSIAGHVQTHARMSVATGIKTNREEMEERDKN